MLDGTAVFGLRVQDRVKRRHERRRWGGACSEVRGPRSTVRQGGSRRSPRRIRLTGVRKHVVVAMKYSMDDGGDIADAVATRDAFFRFLILLCALGGLGMRTTAQ